MSDPRWRVRVEEVVATIEQAENWGLQRGSVGRLAILLGNLLYIAGTVMEIQQPLPANKDQWRTLAQLHNGTETSFSRLNYTSPSGATGQMSSLGVCLAIASIYFLYKPTIYVGQIRDNLWSAVVIGSLHCLTGLSDLLHLGMNRKIGDLPSANGYLPVAVVFLMWAGYAVESHRIQGKYFKYTAEQSK